MRKKLLTDGVLAQIPRWRREEGLGPAEIAARIGCTVGTLRVVCCRRRISLKPSFDTTRNGHLSVKDTSMQLDLTKLGLNLPRLIRHQLKTRATQYGMSELELATVLLETVVRDDLYHAILDDGR
jgi:hypothetical protein